VYVELLLRDLVQLFLVGPLIFDAKNKESWYKRLRKAAWKHVKLVYYYGLLQLVVPFLPLQHLVEK
jgi:hypothetical protein